MDKSSLALAAGGLLLIAFAPALVGGILWSGRNQLHWAAAQSSRRYLYWERSLWIAATILLTLGFSLFAGFLQAEGEDVLSRLGFTAFLIGAVLIIVAEGYSLDAQIWAGYLARWSVVLLFLSEAAFGWGILQIDPLPHWIGWVTIIWNVGWLALLVRAKDPYIPGIHYMMPLVIGAALINWAK